MKIKYLYILFIVFLYASFSTNALAQNGQVAYFPLNGTADDQSELDLDGQGFNIESTIGINDSLNTAIKFNGLDAYINCGSEGRSIVDTLSISVWIKTEMEANGFIVTKYDYNIDRGFHLGVNGGYARLGGRNNSGSYSNTGNSGIMVNDGEWHHIVARIYGNDWDLWVDCEWSSSTESNALNPTLINNQPLTIGNFYLEDNMYFEGSVDELRIFNKLLTESDIENLCSKGITSNLEPSFSDEPAIKLFPNPVYGELNILGLNSSLKSVEIYDFSGKKVLTIENPERVLDVSQLPIGSYFVILRDQMENVVHRESVIKMKGA